MTPTLVLTLAFVVGAPAKKDTAKEPPKLDGDWAMESFEPDKKDPKDLNVTFRFADGKLSVKEARREKPEEADYTVDLKKKPATIDIKPSNAPADIMIRGIVQINGDTMKLCFRRVGERPTEFKADVATQAALIVLKRVKPEK